MTRQHLWTDKINQNKLIFTAHILRLPEGTPARQAFQIALKPVTRPRGRQTITWIQSTNTLLQSVGLDKLVLTNLITIDHPILVHRLHTDFGFTDTVLQWYSSYLTDRTHYVSLSNHCSAFTHVHSGVPQGSVHGPMLLTMHIKHLSAIIDSHSIIHHSFIIHKYYLF